MPLYDLDPNVIRRNSRSSAASVKTVGDATRQMAAVPAGSNDAGVLSMLRTGTETGDIGAFSMTSGRFPKIPRPVPSSASRNGAPSTASSQYSRHNSMHGSIRSAKSQRSARSTRSTRERPPMPGEWPHVHHSSVNQHDTTQVQSDARSSIAQESVCWTPLSGHDRAEASDRSYSLTHSPYPHGHLHMQASVTSLRSQPDHGPPRPRPLHMTGSRFPHPGYPGYRPASPALSDSAGAFSGRRPMMRPPPGPRSYTASPGPSLQGYRGLPRYDLPQHVRPRPMIEDLERPSVDNGHMQRYPATSTHHENDVSSVSKPMPHLHYPLIGDNGPVAVHSDRPRGTAVTSLSEQTLPLPLRKMPADSISFHPHSGFVQRVKNVLEERMSVEQQHWPQRAATPSPQSEQVTAHSTNGAIHVENMNPITLDEDSVEQNCTFEKVEEQHASTEGMRADEEPDYGQEADRTSAVKRLTRDLIKAGVDGMSDIVASSDAAGEAQEESVGGDVPHLTDEAVHNSFSDNDESLYMPEKLESLQREATAEEIRPTPPSAFTTIKSEHPMRDASSMPPPSLWYNISSSSPAASARDLTVQPPDVNRNTYPFHNHTTYTPERPLSLPSEPSQNIEFTTIEGKFDKRIMSEGSQDPMPKSPATNTTSGEGQHAINLASLEASPSSLIPPKNARRESSSTLSTECTTRVTILSSSSSAASSENPSYNLPDEYGRQDRRFRPSSLGTVEENESEPGTGSASVSETVEIISPRASMRGNASADSTRRVSSDGAPSAMKNFHFPLPDLAEDSQEDASTTNLRMLGHKGSGFRGRASFKDHRQLPRPSLQALPPPDPMPSYIGKPLKDTHNLPSFNFSQGNLTAKMNAALGFRNSRSLEDLAHFKLDEVTSSPGHDRPMSISLTRERYRSFFLLEHGQLDDRAAPDGPSPPAESVVRKSSSREEELLGEIERLSIPSVKDLSLRLSELFPSIRSSEAVVDLDKIDAALTRTVQEIRGNVAGKRLAYEGALPGSSGGGSSSAPVTRRGTLTSDVSVAAPFKFQDRLVLQLNKDLPPLPKDSISERSSDSSNDGHYESARDSNETCSDDLGSSEASASVKEVIEHDRDHMQILGEGIGTKFNSAPDLSHVSSPDATPRPWNNPENYPWSEGSETADVTLSSDPPDIVQSSGKPSKHKIQRSRSDPQLRRGNDTLRVIRSMSPGFDAELVPNSTAGEPTAGPEKTIKKGMLRSLSRKRGKKTKPGHADPAIDPKFFHPEEQRNSALNPGDRYPTSALQQPPGVSIDESRSYFSDYSDDEGHDRGSRRRRFTRLKKKRSTPGIRTSPDPSQTASHLELRQTPNPDSTVFVDAPLAPDADVAEEVPPVGMSKAEFHAKRLVEKLRLLFFKSSEVLKHLGRNKRGRQEVALYT